jgi:D-alanyl-D-alanine carboxypeptidase
MYTAPRRPNYRQQLRQPPQTPLLYRLMTRKEFLLTVGGLIIGVIAFAFFGLDQDRGKQMSTDEQSSKQQPTSVASQSAGNDFNKNAYSLTDPKSIWLVVNKKRPLNPKTYTPDNLVVPNIPLRSNITGTEKYVRADMAKALEKMVADAKSEGITFNLQSGYRSYNFQVALYNSYVKSQGQSVADRQSARPGHSEHQTGLAADLGGASQPACNVEACYADTIEGKWLAANAYKYGFLVRYPADKEQTTGYLYEPWHIRYIGAELSNEMHTQGIETLEEFFNLGAAPNY